MRIVHLDHTQAPGGAELALLRTLQHSPWQGTLVVPRENTGSHASVFAEATDSWQLREVGPTQSSGASKASSRLSVARFALGILSQATAIRMSKDFRAADIVHANTSRSAVYGALACWGSRKTLVVHLRDAVDVPSLGSIGFQAFTKLALKRANGIIANSRGTLASAQPYLGGRTRTVVISSPIGAMFENHAPVGPEVNRIGMVARLDPWKGQRLLLQAFSDEFAGTSIRLVFAGSPAFGNETFLHELRVLAQELGVAHQVDFLGHVTDVADCIDSLDICVQSSLRPEPLGQNVLQYLARGRPVIAANEGGPTEWIESGKNGILFQARDRSSLARSLALVVQDATLRRRLAEAALRTPGLLTDEEVAKAHSEFFRLVMNGSRGKSRRPVNRFRSR